MKQLKSLQEIFDVAIGGLIKQGAVSGDADRKPAYRGLNGTKCPVGHMIPDAAYFPGMEGHHAMSDCIWTVLIEEGFLPALPSTYDDADVHAYRLREAVRKALIQSLDDMHRMLLKDNVSPRLFNVMLASRAEKVARHYGVSTDNLLAAVLLDASQNAQAAG